MEALPEGAFAPFSHGPFRVGPDGTLEPLRPPAISFRWRGRDCRAWLDGERMSLWAQAGEVPYTAQRPTDRPGAIAAVGQLPAALPQGWRLRLLPDHRVRLEAVLTLPAAPTATSLVGALVGFALALDPWLDRLESAGLQPKG
jgi:hypothetical protein